jgi:hypothetical protein
LSYTEWLSNTVELHCARDRPRLAGNHVHHRRFAGAVRADDRPQLSGQDIEAEVVQRLESVEADCHAVEIEDGAVQFGSCVNGAHVSTGLLSTGLGPFDAVASPARPLRGRPQRDDGQDALASVPMIPFGRNSVTAMKRPPSANSQSSGMAPVR